MAQPSIAPGTTACELPASVLSDRRSSAVSRAAADRAWHCCRPCQAQTHSPPRTRTVLQHAGRAPSSQRAYPTRGSAVRRALKRPAWHCRSRTHRPASSPAGARQRSCSAERGRAGAGPLGSSGAATLNAPVSGWVDRVTCAQVHPW